MSKPKYNLSNKELASFEDIVRVAARSGTIGLFTHLWSRKDHEDTEAQGRTALFDEMLQVALEEGAGDVDKVWTIFREELDAVPLGMQVVSTGIEVLKGGRKGHVKAHGTAEQKEKRFAGYMEWVEVQRERHPNWNWGVLVADAAKHFKVCQKTIRRHVTNPFR